MRKYRVESDRFGLENSGLECKPLRSTWVRKNIK